MIRLVLEEGGVTYKDFALEGRAGAAEVVKHTAPDFKDGNVAHTDMLIDDRRTDGES